MSDIKNKYKNVLGEMSSGELVQQVAKNALPSSPFQGIIDGIIGIGAVLGFFALGKSAWYGTAAGTAGYMVYNSVQNNEGEVEELVSRAVSSKKKEATPVVK